jgi:antitoxin component of RelBE/YafQ-DinJ toxin-antitoxin module
MEDKQRPTTKPNRLNFRLDDEKMDQFQLIMDSLGLNKTEAFEYLLDIHEHATKIIRECR